MSANPAVSKDHIKFYDSGATRHMSPYHDEFTTMREIVPKPITAANQQNFSAVGIGEMVISVPNSRDASKL